MIDHDGLVDEAHAAIQDYVNNCDCLSEEELARSLETLLLATSLALSAAKGQEKTAAYMHRLADLSDQGSFANVASFERIN
ncbi:hypothetical protein ACIQVE_21305 [Pseudomonas sp. NPDC098747]|uniref:hypothetical protein n=1 Tax=Pseudomonas sp. NPDC098747 TaxID=3364487 RepID=UPI00383B168A